MSRLEARDLTVCRGGRPLVSDLSFVVEPGMTTMIIGPNGAGKSTLLRCLLGLEPPSQGQVFLNHRPLREVTPTERAAAVAWLPQDRSTPEWVSVEALVAAARFRFAEDDDTAKARGRACLEAVGAATLAHRWAHQLSGGERQRVALAALLAQEAPLLLLDEPANHLDPRQQREVYALLGKLGRAEHGVVTVSHDVNLAAHLAPCRVLGLREGRELFCLPWGSIALPEALSDLFGLPFTCVSGPGYHHYLPRNDHSPAGGLP